MRNNYVYILTNTYNTVLYTGVTNDLMRRVAQHKEGLVEGFTKKYNVHKLVYFEAAPSIKSAIEREKQIKAGSRAKRIALIQEFNPDWQDLQAEEEEWVLANVAQQVRLAWLSLG